MIIYIAHANRPRVHHNRRARACSVDLFKGGAASQGKYRRKSSRDLKVVEISDVLRQVLQINQGTREARRVLNDGLYLTRFKRMRQRGLIHLY